MSKKTHEAIYAILSGDSTVTTSAVESRIYPTFVPEDQRFPALIYRITEKQPIDTKDGVIGSVDTLLIEIYDERAAQIVSTADTVRTALDRYRGTAASVVIDRIIFEGESDEMLIPELALFHLTQTSRVRVRY